MRYLYIILFFSLCGFSQEKSEAAIGVAEGVMSIDGMSKEDDWSRAIFHSDFKQLHANKSSENILKFKLLKGRNELFLFAEFKSLKPKSIEVSELKNNVVSVFESETLEFFVDPVGDGQATYQFVVNCLGERFSTFKAEGGSVMRPVYGIGDWESAIHRTEEGWSVEMRIPTSSFIMTSPSKMSGNYRINVASGGPQGLVTWAPVYQGFAQVENFKSLGGMPFRLPNSLILDDISLSAIVDTSGGEVYDSVQLNFAEKSAENMIVSLSVGSPEKAVSVSLKLGASSVILPLPKSYVKDKAIAISILNSVGQSYFSYSGTPITMKEQMSINLIDPFYADCVFPDQDLKELKAELFMPSCYGEISEVSASVEVNHSTRKLDVVLKNDSQWLMNMPIVNLLPGTYEIKVMILSADKKTYTCNKIFRVLDKAPGSTIRFDRDGTMVVDGKRQFMLLFYGGQIGCEYGLSRQVLLKYPESQSIFPQMNRFGHISVEVFRLVPDTKEYLQDVIPSPSVVEAVSRVVKMNRDNKGFFYYYLDDEPDYRGYSPAYLERIYQIIKSLDPYHPVVIASTSPWLFKKAADLLCVHNYPGPFFENSGVRKLGHPIVMDANCILKAKEKFGMSRIGTIPQVFAYSCQNSQSDYLNFDEIQVHGWAAISAGARALVPFYYPGVFERPVNSIGIQFLFTCVRELEELILTDPSELAIEGDGVRGLARRKNDKILIALVNPLSHPVVITCTSPVLQGVKSLQRHGFGSGDPGVVVDNGRITLSLPSMSVVRLVSGLKFTDPSEELARKQLKEQETKRTDPSNVFFEMGLKGTEVSIVNTVSNPLGGSDQLVALAGLFDGMNEALAWRGLTSVGDSSIMLTPASPIVGLKSIKIYGWYLEGMRVEIRDKTSWKQVDVAIDSSSASAGVSVPPDTEISRIRFLFPKQKDANVEIYEIQGFKK